MKYITATAQKFSRLGFLCTILELPLHHSWHSAWHARRGSMQHRCPSRSPTMGELQSRKPHQQGDAYGSSWPEGLQSLQVATRSMKHQSRKEVCEWASVSRMKWCEKHLLWALI